MGKKKYIMDMTVVDNTTIGPLYSLIKVTPADGKRLPEIDPGQFVQIEAGTSKTTYLRRPISVNFVDYDTNLLWLLIRKAGDGTRQIASARIGETINIILPLGKGFSIPEKADGRRFLLVGGGVGVAPLLYLGRKLKDAGLQPEFLIGARSASDLLLIDYFKGLGHVYISTEDGSEGQEGFVTANTALNNKFDMIYCCGPMPMMKAVAAIAKSKSIMCEVSLENKMACGLGACLCCVEKKSDGHNVCVCTEGPVFNTNELPW